MEQAINSLTSVFHKEQKKTSITGIQCNHVGKLTQSPKIPLKTQKPSLSLSLGGVWRQTASNYDESTRTRNNRSFCRYSSDPVTQTYNQDVASGRLSAFVKNMKNEGDGLVVEGHRSSSHGGGGGGFAVWDHVYFTTSFGLYVYCIIYCSMLVSM